MSALAKRPCKLPSRDVPRISQCWSRSQDFAHGTTTSSSCYSRTALGFTDGATTKTERIDGQVRVNSGNHARRRDLSLTRLKVNRLKNEQTLVLRQPREPYARWRDVGQELQSCSCKTIVKDTRVPMLCVCKGRRPRCVTGNKTRL